MSQPITSGAVGPASAFRFLDLPTELKLEILRYHLAEGSLNISAHTF